MKVGAPFQVQIVIVQVLIVRHGETEENVGFIFIQPADSIEEGDHSRSPWYCVPISAADEDTVLNPMGVNQSRLVAEALKDVPLTHAYCSTLMRAKQVHLLLVPIHSRLARRLFDIMRNLK